MNSSSASVTLVDLCDANDQLYAHDMFGIRLADSNNFRLRRVRHHKVNSPGTVADMTSVVTWQLGDNVSTPAAAAAASSSNSVTDGESNQSEVDDRLSTPDIHRLIRNRKAYFNLRQKQRGGEHLSTEVRLRSPVVPREIGWHPGKIPTTTAMTTPRIDRYRTRVQGSSSSTPRSSRSQRLTPREDQIGTGNDNATPSGRRATQQSMPMTVVDSTRLQTLTSEPKSASSSREPLPDESISASRRRRKDMMNVADEARRQAALYASGSRTRGTRFVDLVNRIQARRALVESGVADASETNGRDDDDESNMAAGESVANRLGSETTGSGNSTTKNSRSNSVAASFGFFVNIRDLNEQIVSGKASRKSSTAVRPSTSGTNDVRRPEETKGKSIVTMSISERSEMTAVHDGVGTVTAAGRENEGMSNDAPTDNSITYRRQAVVRPPPVVHVAPMFYEPPLVPVVSQNTESKFYAGSNVLYRLPARLPERLVIET